MADDPTYAAAASPAPLSPEMLERRYDGPIPELWKAAKTSHPRQIRAQLAQRMADLRQRLTPPGGIQGRPNRGSDGSGNDSGGGRDNGGGRVDRNRAEANRFEVMAEIWELLCLPERDQD